MYYSVFEICNYICTMIKVLLLSDLLGDPDRRMFKGLVQFANEHGGWRFYTVHTSVSDDPEQCTAILEKARSLGVDVIFGQWTGVNAKTVNEYGIPVILRTFTPKYPDFPQLYGDYYELGRIGGEFFKKKHFLSYAYIGVKGLFWSDERLRGFRDVVSGKESVFSHYIADNFDKERNKIGNWLKSLPKPLALLACNDINARKVCEVCQDIGINIPEDISILGIDDSEFLCNFSYPTISSIKLNFEKQGYELAKVIYKIISEKKVMPYRIYIEPMGIEERASTLKYILNDPCVRQIVTYIEEHFSEDIKVADIIRDVTLSQRSIEMRFKKEMGPHTILSFLSSVRVDNMCWLLSTTQLSVYEAALQSGFSNPVNVSKVFKSFKGCSPAEWRKKNSYLHK